MPKTNKPTPTKKLTRAEKQQKIGQEHVARLNADHDPYLALFEHMNDEHGIILLNSEMDEIAKLCKVLLGSQIVSHE